MRPSTPRPALALLLTLLTLTGCVSARSAGAGSASAGGAAPGTATTASVASASTAASIAASTAASTAASAGSSGSATGLTPAAAGAARVAATALLPIQHGGAHPGAAVLAGDVKHLARASFRPTTSRAPKDETRTCQVIQPSSTPKYCAYGDLSHPTRTVALVGDSVAGAWAGALTEIAAAHHWKLLVATHSRCPWTATMTVNLGHPGPYTACRTWGQRVLHDLLATYHPSVVITSDRPVLGTPSQRPGAAASTSIGRGMTTYWRQLAAHGIPVVALREAPEMGIDIPRCVARSGPSACSVPRSRAVARTTPVMVATRLDRDRVHLIDLTGYICARHSCPAVVGNVLVYQDQHHLTDTYAKTIAPYLERRLLALPAFAS